MRDRLCRWISGLPLWQRACVGGLLLVALYFLIKEGIPLFFAGLGLLWAQIAIPVIALTAALGFFYGAFGLIPKKEWAKGAQGCLLWCVFGVLGFIIQLGLAVFRYCPDKKNDDDTKSDEDKPTDT